MLDEPRPKQIQLTVWDGAGFRDLGWDAWRFGAASAGTNLRRLGVVHGTRVACLLTNSVGACVGLIGAWLAGATVVSLPTIARGMSQKAYARQLYAMLRESEAELVLVEGRLAGHLADLEVRGRRVVAYEQLVSSGRIEPDPPIEREVALIQYTSGSTTEPRGCLLSVGAIERQLALLRNALELEPEDLGVSWLPLSHDMGLFGCLMLCFWGGMKLVLGTPERFMRSPRTWFADVAARHATITAGPNTAFELAARAAKRAPRHPGRSLRACVIGGEPVEATTLARVKELLGVPDGALMPAYGLAEAVLAVTMTPSGVPPRVLSVERDPLRRGVVRETSHASEDAAILVSSGRCLPGVVVRAASEDGLGELCVRSPSLADGYVARPGLTAERFVNGELRTGDFGFIHRGEIYVVDRVDDQLNVAGRKIWAGEVESLLQRDVAVRRGACVVVEIAGAVANRLVAMVEPTGAVENYDVLAARLVRAVAGSGVTLSECLVVAHGTLPKTPSGKIQRHRCRELVEEHNLAVLGSLPTRVRAPSNG